MLRSTPLKRKTPLRKKSRTPVAIEKDKLWELCKKITRKLYGNVCYTCGATELEGSNWHTGHFITDATCSTELSYDLNNLRPQCYRCNIHLSGNWIAFEQAMIKERGVEFIEALKKRNQQTKGLKYDILWFKQKVQDYQLILERL